MLGLFIPAGKKASIFVVDTVRSNQMPNLNNLYNNERASYIQRNRGEESAERIPEADYLFEVRVETDIRQVYRHLQRLLNTYKEEKRGPTIIALQAGYEESGLCLSDKETLLTINRAWKNTGCIVVRK